MPVTGYRIQTVLHAYHRRLTSRDVEGAPIKPAGEGLLGMTRGTRAEIERQVASQIRRRLILRTFKG
ncbi:MAG: hypothetical protein ACUVXD_17185 [Thermodesulfobacteriota bacterium]